MRALVCIAFGSLALWSSPALAQNGGPLTHDGFYLQLGAGLGYLSVSSDHDSYSGVTVPASHVYLGGSPVRGFALGGGLIMDYSMSPSSEVGGQEVDLTDVSQYLLGIGVVADVYPDPGGGLHFQGFLGVGGVETSVRGNVGGSDPLGMVLAFGVGYEFWVSNQWSIGPLFRLAYAPLSMNDVSFTTIAPALMASFTLH